MEEAGKISVGTADALENLIPAVPEPEIADYSWKPAYIDYIERNTKTYDSWSGTYVEEFKLIDINGDAIPELYINFMYGYAGNSVISYYNGSLIEVNFSGGLTYIEGQGLFCSSGRGSTGYRDTIYQMEDGEFTVLGEGVCGITCLIPASAI